MLIDGAGDRDEIFPVWGNFNINDINTADMERPGWLFLFFHTVPLNEFIYSGYYINICYVDHDGKKE